MKRKHFAALLLLLSSCLGARVEAFDTRAVVEDAAGRALVVAADRMWATPQAVAFARYAREAGAGVLYLYGHYYGDMMNFDMAAELARAEGIEVAAVVTDDDVAVKDSLYTAGRRGVGGTVLVEKLCGAAAQRGDTLAAVAALGRDVNARVRSMGMALSSCTVPASYPSTTSPGTVSPTSERSRSPASGAGLPNTTYALPAPVLPGSSAAGAPIT